MNTKQYIIISCIALAIGIFGYAYMNELFVIYIPHGKNYISTTEKEAPATRKKISLFFWNKSTMQHESAEIMWTAQNDTNASTVIQQLLTLFADEKVTKEKISLQSAQFSPSGQELYISLSTSPFDKELSIYDKLMVLESILKTLRTNIVGQGFVHILVNHQPLNDDHLDCSTLLPISGYGQQ